MRSNQSLVLLLVSLLVIFCRLCYCIEVFLCPAKCGCLAAPRIISCSRHGLRELPENISETVRSLDLSDNQLSELSPQINRLKDLEQLNLARNRLTALPEDLSQLTRLERLDLSRNNIRSVRDGLRVAIEQLVSLTSLDLSRNGFEDLDELSHNELQNLAAEENEIRVFDSKTLRDLPKLRSLSLRGNKKLGNLERPSSTSLINLDLSNCNIEKIRPNTFVDLVALANLHLAHNQLANSALNFSLVHFQLKELDLSSCGIQQINLSQLLSLQHLKLGNNNLRSISDETFSRNSRLTFVFLNGNQIDRISKRAFAKLQKLVLLDLSLNALQKLPPTLFQDCLKLKILNLSYNAFEEVPTLQTTVMELDLQSNNIKLMNRSCLIGMKKLTSLQLANNYLETLPDYLESNTLKTFLLPGNHLKTLRKKMLPHLYDLESLDLSRNKFSVAFDPVVFQNNRNLVNIRLDANPWRCDCKNLHPLYNYLESKKRENLNGLKCDTEAQSGNLWDYICESEWSDRPGKKNKTWGLVLVTVLTTIVLFGTLISVRHSMKLKRQARNQRQEVERAEIRERFRLLQRRNQMLQDELREQSSDSRIVALELVGPPSYEEALQFPRFARSLEILNGHNPNSVHRITASSESLRSKKRRTRRSKNLRVLSEDDFSRREFRREQRLRRTTESSVGNNQPAVGNEDNEQNAAEPTNSNLTITAVSYNNENNSGEDEDLNQSPRQLTPPTPRTRKKARMKKRTRKDTGTSGDDEDSSGT